jgi:Uma2 family endonuclease
MRIASLKEYVLVSPATARIEVYRRPDRGHWSHEEARAGQSLQILGRAIAVDDIYARASASSAEE